MLERRIELGAVASVMGQPPTAGANEQDGESRMHAYIVLVLEHGDTDRYRRDVVNIRSGLIRRPVDLEVEIVVFGGAGTLAMSVDSKLSRRECAALNL